MAVYQEHMAEHFGAAPLEALPSSQEVYKRVIEEALAYSVLPAAPGARAQEFYAGSGVRRVTLQPYGVELGRHYGFDADQSVQPTGAYKDRAATGARLGADSTYVTAHVASAGNAGAAYARGGGNVAVHCAQAASPEKLARIRGYGASVIAAYPDLEAAQAGAALASQEAGGVLFHPFDRVSVIAGNATVGFELVADLLHQQDRGVLNLRTDPLKVFVPVGGGGLIAGVAIAVKWAKEQGYLGEDNLQVVGVQMEGCDAMKRTVDYLHAGQVPPEDLFATGAPFNANSDGTAVRRPGNLTTAVASDRDFVADIVCVTEGELGWEMHRQYQRTGQKYEPAGMLARTAAKKYAQLHAAAEVPEALVTITSGANVSDELFAKMTKAGLDHMLQVWQPEEDARRAERYRMQALGTLAAGQPGGHGAAGRVRTLERRSHVASGPTAYPPEQFARA